MTLEQIRASDAARKSAFYRGDAERHPHGVSGMKYITAPEDDRRCMETSASPEMFQFGEYFRLSGSDFHVHRAHEWVFHSRRSKRYKARK